MKVGSRVAWALLLVALATATASAERATEVYKVKHRTAAELIPLAQTALAGQGTAVIDQGTNSIVLIGDATAVKAAVDLLNLQDQSRKSIVVTVDSHEVQALDAAGYRIDWSVGSRSFRVGNVLSPGAGTFVHATGRILTTASDSTFSATVRILDGDVGRISTGRSVPVTTRDRFGSSTTFVEASSGLEARARVLGDGRVQLELTPFQGQVDARGRVAFSDATTTVVVKPGETIAVGGLYRHGTSSTDSVLRSRSRTERVDEQVLLLRVEVEG